jgi:hypothetical protein
MPDRHRPYRIPMSDRAVNWYCIIPTALCCVMLVVVKVDTLIIGAVGITISIIAYFISTKIVGAKDLINFDVLDE